MMYFKAKFSYVEDTGVLKLDKIYIPVKPIDLWEKILGGTPVDGPFLITQPNGYVTLSATILEDDGSYTEFWMIRCELPILAELLAEVNRYLSKWNTGI